jgi:hypothetical protein
VSFLIAASKNISPSNPHELLIDFADSKENPKTGLTVSSTLYSKVSMEIQITLQKEDWKLYQSYIEKALPKQQKTWMDSFWINLFVWMGLAMVFMAIFQSFSHFHWPTAASVAIFFVLIFVLFLFNMFKIRKAFEPLESGIFCGRHKFTFTSDGIITEGKGYEGHHSWEIVKKIERAPGMILIYLDKVYAYVFPESKLDDPDEFYNYISEQYSNVTNQSSRRPSSTAD